MKNHSSNEQGSLSSYDAIIIGSGLGGLTAGALLAKDGRKVLVLERHKIFGGAATIFRRPGINVEVGLHEIDGFDPDDRKLRVLSQLNIGEELQWIKAPSFFAATHPSLGDQPFEMPDGRRESIDATAKRFPAQKKGIKKYFRTICGLRRRTTFMGRWLQGSPIYRLVRAPLLPAMLWPIIKHDRTTVGDFLDRLFGDDEAVKLALAANLAYYSDDPHRMSLIYFAAAQGSFIAGGGRYLKGGSQKLSDRLVEIIEQAGGQARAKRDVRQVKVEDGRVVGVTHYPTQGAGNPEDAHAPIVIGNASPHHIQQMLPEEHRKTFFKPYENRKLATSLWTIYLGFDRPPAQLGLTHYSHFILPNWQKSLADFSIMSALLKDHPTSKMPFWVIVNYDNIDAGLTDEGRHFAVMCGLDRLDNWEHLSESDYRSKKDAWLAALIGELERHVPGIGRHIVYQEMATARTLQRYLNTPGGTPYGFEQLPTNAGRHRPGAQTSLPGLYLASAFTAPGGGFTGAILAGEYAFAACKKMY